MEGFTGLDVKRAEKDINTFEYMAHRTFINLYAAFYEFYKFLNHHWASQVAFEFTSKNSQEINELNDKMLTSINHIVNGASVSAEQLAKVIGVSLNLMIDDNFAGVKSTYGLPCEPCKEVLNGVVGMDTEGVKQSLFIFRTSYMAALEELDAIPEGIHFYDPNGDLVGGYNRGIRSFKQEYQELANNLYTDMKKFIESDTDNILLAKEKAVDTLNA